MPDQPPSGPYPSSPEFATGTAAVPDPTAGERPTPATHAEPRPLPDPNSPVLQPGPITRVPMSIDPDDPRWRYRVTLIYANDAQPPSRAGQVAMQTVHTDETTRDTEVNSSIERDDIGRILVEQRIGDDITIDRRTAADQWRGLQAWTRDDTTREWTRT